MAGEGAELMFISASKYCTFCFKCVSEKLKQHICKHLESLKFKCKICSKVYRSKYDLNIHQKVKHEDFMFIYEVDSCSKIFKSSARLHAHRRKEHTVINDYLYVCPSCKNGFDHKVKFEDHKRKVHGANQLQCADCERTFIYMSNFIRHKRSCKNIEVFRGKLYGCMKCKPTKRLKRLSYLKEHDFSFHSDKKDAFVYACKICKKLFNTRSSRFYHSKSCSAFV